MAFVEFFLRSIERYSECDSQVDEKDLVSGIDKRWLGGYSKTHKAINMNRKRIQERS